MNEPVLSVRFFKTSAGREPVRDFLMNQTAENRKRIGENIKTVQFGWPLGMPLVQKMEPRLWEIRTTIDDGMVRVFFTVTEGQMVLLHSLVKKSRKTPQMDLNKARQRLTTLRNSS